MSEHRRWDRAFVAGLLLGGAVMLYGIVGLLDATTMTRARQIAMWVVGGDLLHDALLAPIAAAVGLLGSRMLPNRVWPVVRAGLVASACAVAVAYPMLRGFTRDAVPDNASAAPLDYVSAVATVLAVVWTIVGGYLFGAWLVARRRSRAMSDSAPSPPSPPRVSSPVPRSSR
jgi:hypothetical protein